MKRIIDIPNYDLNEVKNGSIACGEILKAVRNGKPYEEGEWIIVKDEKWGDNVKCPFCGKELAGTDLNFCCKCGADMRKEADNEKTETGYWSIHRS